MNTFASFLDGLKDSDVADTPAPAPPPPEYPEVEIVVEKKSGKIRQAGADIAGSYVEDFRKACERDLFTFCRGVLGRTDLTETLHKPLCQRLTAFPPRRKLRLLPRHHRKTSIVSQGLPLHMAVQPQDANMYFPGEQGTNVRILLSGETEKLATGNLRVIQSALESNKILRGLWPHVVWDRPRAEAKKWNDLELILRRPVEYPEATVTARGVGGAITGLHPNVLIKDDLISFEAANSEAVMASAIAWHVASRGLIEGNPDSLEFIIGTRWAAWDLYRYIIENDPEVEIEIRAAVEEGAIIFPEKFDHATLDRLRKDFGVLYPLLYLNTAIGTQTTDFDMAEVRSFTLSGRTITFDSDERDTILVERAKPAERQRESDRDFTDARMYGGAHRLRYG